MKSYTFQILLLLFLLPGFQTAQVPDTTQANILLENAINQLDVSNFDSSATLAGKALRIFQKVFSENHPKIADCYNNLGRCLMNQDQFEEALSTHEKALNIRIQSLGNNDPKVASSYNNIGNCYLSLGDFENALHYHKLAERIRTINRKTHPLDLAISYVNIGNCYYLFGDYGNAFAYYEEALSIREKILGAEDLKSVGIQINLGNCLLQGGDYKEALSFYNKALEGFKKQGEVAHPNVADIYLSSGNCFLEMNKINAALENYEKALTIKKEIYGANSSKVADIYQSMGHAFAQKGDFAKGLEYFRVSQNLRSKILPEGHPDFADSYDAIGLFYFDQGAFDLALSEQKKALQIRSTSLGENNPTIGINYSNIGNVFLELEEYDSAIIYYQKASFIANTNPLLAATNFNNLGICFYEKRQYPKALFQFKKAADIFPESNPDLPQYYKNISSAYFKMGKLEKADEFINQALAILKFTRDNPLKNPDAARDILSLINLKAQIYKQQFVNKKDTNVLSQSQEFYEIGLNLIDTLRLSFTESGSRQKLIESHFQIFNGAIDTYFDCWKQFQDDVFLEKAFQVSEKSKSLILLEALRKSNAENFGDIPDSLLKKESDLQTDILYFEKQRHAYRQAGYETEALSFEKEIFELKQAQRALNEQLENNFPKYHQLKYQSKNQSIASIQRDLINSNQGILEFFTGDSSIFAFIITKDDFRGFEIEKNFPLDPWVWQIRRSILFAPNADNTSAKEFNQAYVKAAYGLYSNLFEDLTELLPERLVIIPDAALSYLPFEILLTESPEKITRFKTHSYLLQEYKISYSYSVSLMQEMQQRSETSPRKQLLAFAPSFENNSQGLHPLTYNQSEVEKITSLASGRHFLDKNASLHKFLEIASDYKFIHLATHGKADALAGDYSFLAFTQLNDSIQNKLFVKDLYNLDLPSEMVVLSACETGVGEFQAGEGVVSLARGFSYAGAKSIITSLWSVNDAKTAFLMQAFYEKIKEGLPKDEALQKAKIDFLKKHPNDEAHPYYWAAFISIGNMAPIELNDNSWIGWGIGVLGILLLAFVFIRKRKSNRKV